ncbi:unnamed protein product [Peronospora belbahrii]|uniref:Uncharacterized protein n=1 Tax=Peronospora belbahrii TaxID=622444 RepID=A0AAU9KMJ5_9STRA|nr:unnamed protein product [Peronospora belbahrii]CAH0515472.1 unnamed protein product [Peronospora belbahrii]
MSPNEFEAAGQEVRQQPRAYAGRNRYDAQDEKLMVKEDKRKAQEWLLDLLLGLNKQMNRIEASHEMKERLKSLEASVFGRDTYAGVLQRGYADAAANVKMALVPQPALPQHVQPPSLYNRSVPQQLSLDLTCSVC